jgi:hypothetical protein
MRLIRYLLIALNCILILQHFRQKIEKQRTCSNIKEPHKKKKKCLHPLCHLYFDICLARLNSLGICLGQQL